MKTEERANVDRDLEVVGFSHGDHSSVTARVFFVEVRRFSNKNGVNATIVVRCPGCCWSARATQFKSADYVRDTTVAKIFVQALNNFRSKVPASCADALAAFVLTS